MKKYIGVLLEEKTLADLDDWAWKNKWTRSHAARTIIDHYFNWCEAEEITVDLPQGSVTFTPKTKETP